MTNVKHLIHSHGVTAADGIHPNVENDTSTDIIEGIMFEFIRKEAVSRAIERAVTETVRQ